MHLDALAELTTIVELVYLLSNAHPFGRMLTGTYGLSFVYLPSEQDRTATKEVSVSLRKATIRECLNAIVKSAGDTFYWHIHSLRQRGKWIHGKEIEFRFYWVGQGEVNNERGVIDKSNP